MAADVRIDIAAEFVGKKAFKQADTATAQLSKSVKTLGRNLGLAFGSAAILAYGKKAVKAFAEDQRAAQSLTKTIENLGLGFGGSALEVNNYISKLEQQTGVLDDELRPAMDRLLRATGSITQSQELLGLALDVAAGTGKSLTQVSQSLQKAYLGQTQALGRLGVGLSKAELTSSSFEEIQARLTELFAGQAQTAADGYAGSIARLQVAANNAAESIGKDLFNAVGTLSGGDGLPKTIALIEGLASGIGDAVIGISRLIRNIGILASGNPLESIRDLRAATAKDRAADMKERAQYGGAAAEIYKTQVANLAVTKKIVTQSKILTKETAAQLKAKKDKIALDKAELTLNKAKDLFDLDAIQLQAALTNQSEILAKSTTQSQQLQIANDVARLNVKRDILVLEDAIAAGDAKAATAAAAKLNADLGVLAALTGQNVKMVDIKSILDSLKPVDLINESNLDAALAKIREMLALLALATGQSKAGIPTSGSMGSGIPIGDYIAPISTTGASMSAILEYADAAAARANAFADLLDLQNASDAAAYNASPLSAAGGKVDINIYANTISNPDELVNLIQDTVIKLNKRGDYLTSAGAL